MVQLSAILIATLARAVFSNVGLRDSDISPEEAIRTWLVFVSIPTMHQEPASMKHSLAQAMTASQPVASVKTNEPTTPPSSSSNHPGPNQRTSSCCTMDLKRHQPWKPTASTTLIRSRSIQQLSYQQRTPTSPSPKSVSNGRAVNCTMIPAG